MSEIKKMDSVVTSFLALGDYIVSHWDELEVANRDYPEDKLPAFDEIMAYLSHVWRSE